MQALVKERPGPGELRLVEVPEPSPGPGEVLIQVKEAGICGTDLHLEEGQFPCHPPVILGHEFAGEIAACGPGVTAFQPGDRVVAEPHRGGCGTCRHCLSGAVEVCARKRALGYRVDGCFTTRLVLPLAVLHRIPAHVSFAEAALAEPLAVSVKAVLLRSRVEAGDLVVVQGCGPIGLLAAQVARAGGARQVLVTGTQRDEQIRLPLARRLGFEQALNVQQVDVPERVRELTHGAGADLVIEASGAAPAIAQAFELLRMDGRLCGLGLSGREQLNVPWDLAMRKALHLSFSYSSNWESWERGMALLGAGKIQTGPLITHSFPLAEWSRAFGLLRALEAVKILFHFA